MIRLALFLPFLLALTSPSARSGCGAYPWEFNHTFCPTGTAVFVCTTVDGLEHWVFVGCWEQ